MEQAVLEPFAIEALTAMRDLGFATAIWTNNDRLVADFVLARFDLLRHLDLVVTRDDVTALKPDPDGLRVVRERWPEAPHIVWSATPVGRTCRSGGRRSFIATARTPPSSTAAASPSRPVSLASTSPPRRLAGCR
jgi:hypothetical protein